MSVFYCHGCERDVDSDFEESFEDPKDGTQMLCEKCHYDEFWGQDWSQHGKGFVSAFETYVAGLNRSIRSGGAL